MRTVVSLQKLDPVQVLMTYVGSYTDNPRYLAINSALATGDDLVEPVASEVAALRQLIKRQRPLPVGTHLWRGGATDAAGAERLLATPAGRVVLLSPGFGSLTRLEHIAEGFPRFHDGPRIMWDLRVARQGARGVDVQRYLDEMEPEPRHDYRTEWEVLTLDRSRVRVQSAVPDPYRDDTVRVTGNLLPPAPTRRSRAPH